jgi:hypothetical protein
MNENNRQARLLKVLLRRARDNEIINLFELAADCGQSVFVVLKSLSLLQEKGLVDARRLRLTLQGLAWASALTGPRVLAERERKSERCPPRRRHAA